MSSSVARRKQRRPLVRSSTATSRSSAVSVRSGPPSAAAAMRTAASRSRSLGERLAQPPGDRLGVAAEHGEAALVHHRAVVEDVEQLSPSAVRPTSATRISTSIGFISWVNTWPRICRVLVGQAARVDVLAAVLEALEVGGAHAGDAQLVELVVPADAGEGDAVVDLADLAQRVAGVLGDERDAVVVADGDQRPGPWRCPCAA